VYPIIEYAIFHYIQGEYEGLPGEPASAAPLAAVRKGAAKGARLHSSSSSSSSSNGSSSSSSINISSSSINISSSSSSVIIVVVVVVVVIVLIIIIIIVLTTNTNNTNNKNKNTNTRDTNNTSYTCRQGAQKEPLSMPHHLKKQRKGTTLGAYLSHPSHFMGFKDNKRQ
jgi:preprotein translocase subunit SecG